MYGFLQRKNGLKGTATAHKCSVCLNAVHINCCSSLLGISVEDDTTALFCSTCAPPGLCNVSAHATYSHKPHVSEVQKDRSGNSEIVDNTKNCGYVDSSESGSKRSGAFCRSFQQVRKDLDHFLYNSALPNGFQTEKQREDNEIKAALNFIFQSQNIQMLSQGTKRIRLVAITCGFLLLCVENI